MIATVRIAPVERWCKPLLSVLEKHPALCGIVGQEVNIIPSSMGQFDDCKFWALTEQSSEKIRQMTPGIPNRYGNHGGNLLCEHMLEMD